MTGAAAPAEASALPRRISLLVSDVDGTLVTPDKSLTPAAAAAARQLGALGIAFTLVSSRPPRGMAMLTAPLALQGPLAAFNGGAIVRADLSIVTQRFVAPAAARTAIDMLHRHDIDVWLFADDAWFVTDLAGAYVDKERHTVQFEPTRVDTFEPYLERVGKIVGSSRDFAALERCEGELQGKVRGVANARRSQDYYLDVTPQGADKGDAITELARAFGVPLGEVAAIGDMTNDVPMFEKAGLAIAMGNAEAAVKAQAHCMTGPNTADGFAAAVARFVLPRAPIPEAAP